MSFSVGRTFRLDPTCTTPIVEQGVYLEKGVNYVVTEHMASRQKFQKLITKGFIDDSAPVITGSYTAASVSVTGTETAPNGETITVYKNGVSAGTTTVTSNAWTKAALTFVGGDVVTAKTGTGLVQSSPSNAVTIKFSAPVVTGSYTAASVSATGTLTAADGTLITVYKNGVSAGTTTITTNAWTKTGLTFAGTDVITAKAGSGLTLSAASASVTVKFNAPVVTGGATDTSTTISGTSDAADGTAVKVFKAGVTDITTLSPVVTAGVWSVTVSPAVATADSITAKVGTGAAQSAASAPVVVP